MSAPSPSSSEDASQSAAIVVEPTVYGVPRQKRESSLAFKPAFEAFYREVLGDEGFARYVAETMYYLPKAVRMNALKANPERTAERLRDHFTLTPIPWVPHAYWVSGERRDIGNRIEHQLGYCYIQEAASMLPPIVLAPEQGMRVLDIAASPGSKTTQLAAMMGGTGVVIANDMGARLRALGINVQKCGCTAVMITNMDGRRFSKLQFDRILADVPCSATGTVQRSAMAISMWSDGFVRKLVALQKELARTAFEALVPGGRMVYSTCTLDPRENEGVVSYLVSLGARVLPIDLPLRREQPFTSFRDDVFDPSVALTLRIHPYTNNTEGFFVALLEKPSP